VTQTARLLLTSWYFVVSSAYFSAWRVGLHSGDGSAWRHLAFSIVVRRSALCAPSSGGVSRAYSNGGVSGLGVAIIIVQWLKYSILYAIGVIGVTVMKMWRHARRRKCRIDTLAACSPGDRRRSRCFNICLWFALPYVCGAITLHTLRLRLFPCASTAT